MHKFIFSVVLATIVFALTSFVSVEAHADSYGAFSANLSTGVNGWSYGYGGHYDAVSAAVSVCGNGCELLVSLHGECGAIATVANLKNNGQYVFAWSTGYSTSGAAANGLNNYCSQQGFNCIGQRWICTF